MNTASIFTTQHEKNTRTNTKAAKAQNTKKCYAKRHMKCCKGETMWPKLKPVETARWKHVAKKYDLTNPSLQNTNSHISFKGPTDNSFCKRYKPNVFSQYQQVQNGYKWAYEERQQPRKLVTMGPFLTM